MAERSRIFSSGASRRRVARDLVVLAVLFVAVSLAVRQHVPLLADASALRAFVDGFGPWAPVAFVVLQALQVVAAPVPGQVVGFAGGYLFGTLPGAAYSLVGVGIGSYVAYALAGRYGRPYVESVVAPETVERFDAVTERRALGSLFVVFLVPGLPDDAICFVAGLTDIDRWKLVAVAVVGRAPGFLAATAAGASLASRELLLTGSLVLAVAALSALGYLWRGRLADYLDDGAAGSDGGDDAPDAGHPVDGPATNGGATESATGQRADSADERR